MSQVEKLNKLIADLEEQVAEKDGEIAALEEEGQRLREAVADEWRQWAEGGKAWKLEKRVEELEASEKRMREFMAAIPDADEYVIDEDAEGGYREMTLLETYEREQRDRVEQSVNQ